MRSEYPNVLVQNNLTVTESGERITIRFKRNILYLTATGLVGLAFLITGLWSLELKVLLISITMTLLCTLSIIRKWNGRTAFIIDQQNNQLVFPASNEYEQTSGIALNAITDVTLETARNGAVNYIFIEQPNKKSELLLTLRTGTESELNDLLNWLKQQLQEKTVTNSR